MQVLTLIMSRAVPDVQIESAEVVESVSRTLSLYWIRVKPNHDKYWERFMVLYPHWKQVGWFRNLGSRFVPIFPSRAMLIDWLSDVLGLTQGERNFLQLCVR
ncbi:hypothetical protein DRO59_06105 [Candidatus Bathyarchaeota archaeon]|nr:MAG: hypothetical protein DRO59_06105 [Candidatus Bathyarchaeota archaeon]